MQIVWWHFLKFFFLDAESFSIWSISHYYFDFKSKDIERGKLFFNEMFSKGVKFSSFDLFWLLMIIYLLCFQFEGKQMFSCPVIIVEALENVTNFVSILKRYVIWYIWIWYCSSIFFFLFYMYMIYDIIYIIFQQNENEGKDISGSKDICKWYCHEWLSVRWIIKKYGT